MNWATMTKMPTAWFHHGSGLLTASNSCKSVGIEVRRGGLNFWLVEFPSGNAFSRAGQHRTVDRGLSLG